MQIKEALKDKAVCYATDKVRECDADDCRFYRTCLAHQRKLAMGFVKNRDDILNKETWR